MGQSDDIEDSTYSRHQDLCQKLNMDATAASEAWRSYETIRQNYTLEVVIYLGLFISVCLSLYDQPEVFLRKTPKPHDVSHYRCDKSL